MGSDAVGPHEGDQDNDGEGQANPAENPVHDVTTGSELSARGGCRPDKAGIAQR